MEVSGSEDLCGVEDRALDEASGSLPFPSALVPSPATKPVGGPFHQPWGASSSPGTKGWFSKCVSWSTKNQESSMNSTLGRPAGGGAVSSESPPHFFIQQIFVEGCSTPGTVLGDGGEGAKQTGCLFSRGSPSIRVAHHPHK